VIALRFHDGAILPDGPGPLRRSGGAELRINNDSPFYA
jgi:hypothetical protein